MGDRYRVWHRHPGLAVDTEGGRAYVVTAGQRVAVGELVARNGATGNAPANAPHVHFEVHPGGGAAVNPYQLLLAVC